MEGNRMKPAMKRFLELWLAWVAIDLVRRAAFFFSFGGVSAAVPFLDLLGALGIDPFILLLTAILGVAVTGGGLALGHITLVAVWRRFDRLTAIILCLVIFVGVFPWFMPTTHFIMSPEAQLQGQLGLSVVAAFLFGLILLIRWIAIFFWRKVWG